jgi:hypothetical protein
MAHSAFHTIEHFSQAFEEILDANPKGRVTQRRAVAAG